MSEQQKPHLVKSESVCSIRPAEDVDERYRAPALDKGLDILEALAATEIGLTQAEVAKALDRSPSEIYRMLDRLVRRGYVVRSTSERYELSLKLFTLAHRHAPRRRLVALAVPVMRRFAQAAEQSCHLTMFDRGRVVVVAQLDAPGYFGLAIRVGSQVPLFGTGSGHVLLAFQTAQERTFMLGEHAASTGETAPDGLEDRLARLRKRGYERMESRQSRGVTNLAAPVLGPDASVVAAMSCAFLAHVDNMRPNVTRAATLLTQTAAELTGLAGGQIVERRGGIRP